MDADEARKKELTTKQRREVSEAIKYGRTMRWDDLRIYHFIVGSGNFFYIKDRKFNADIMRKIEHEFYVDRLKY